jgi:hypothetical protein
MANQCHTIDEIETTTNQYKLEHISYNQCSWFCVEVLLELKQQNWEISSLLSLDKRSELVEWYERVLISASEKRRRYGKLTWGESLFSKQIHNSHNFSLCITSINKCEYTPPNHSSPDKNLIYMESMRDIQRYKDNLESISFEDLKTRIRSLENVNNRKYIMINRFGQSFLIFPRVIDDNRVEFIIFDSHKSAIIICDAQNVVLYILQNSTSYSFIIYVEGEMNQSAMDSAIIGSLYDDM